MAKHQVKFSRSVADNQEQGWLGTIAEKDHSCILESLNRSMFSLAGFPQRQLSTVQCPDTCSDVWQLESINEIPGGEHIVHIMTCWWTIYDPVVVLVVCSHLRLTVSIRYLYVNPDMANSTAMFI